MVRGKCTFQGDMRFLSSMRMGCRGAPSARKVLPFLESLLSFLELDCGELTPMFQKIGDSWERRITEVTGRQEQQP